MGVKIHLSDLFIHIGLQPVLLCDLRIYLGDSGYLLCLTVYGLSGVIKSFTQFSKKSILIYLSSDVSSSMREK